MICCPRSRCLTSFCVSGCPSWTGSFIPFGLPQRELSPLPNSNIRPTNSNCASAAAVPWFQRLILRQQLVEFSADPEPKSSTVVVAWGRSPTKGNPMGNDANQQGQGGQQGQGQGQQGGQSGQKSGQGGQQQSS